MALAAATVSSAAPASSKAAFATLAVPVARAPLVHQTLTLSPTWGQVSASTSWN